ncbi:PLASMODESMATA CALLOSE-BINDING PROTEIN 3 [Hibiscus syriacus]|uniref:PLASMODESMATA CALLOSE-BINDING PROTEIN 3 n=1 Tax=Hibiscus syriacus TaxID=106335 RepID=A0A6A2X8E6_HIBSY|nr:PLASMODESMATA CALLOSE-BINDING PROTEIN 3-like isoform X1 [Hibiscus syriacus]KAE8654679.1 PLASMODESMATA CALLOSE-BINDING PROTEIN 3 [Hibiscus syriacus]
MALFICLVLFLAMTGHSSATYCLCKDGVGDQQLQKTLDYACGAGADCSAILQKGGCYNPNTVKDHCNYAVNSYFQRKGQAQDSCDFSGTAAVSPNPPPNVASTCSFPSSGTGAANTGTTTQTGTTTTGSTTTGTPTTVFGGAGSTLGPTGTTGINDPGSAVGLFTNHNLFFTFAATATLWIIGSSWL